MNQYALVTDTLQGAPFGYVVTSASGIICHGVTSRGHAWAHEYNSGQVKNYFDNLPVGVEIGRFGPLTKSIEHAITTSKKGLSNRLPQAPFYRRLGSEAFDYVGDGPKGVSAKTLPLTDVTFAKRQNLINFKASSFRGDVGHTNVMAKARFSNSGVLPGDTGIASHSFSEGILQITSGSTSRYRRTVSDYVEMKSAIYDSLIPVKYSEKKLGPKLRRAGRAMEPYDPNAIDGDEDGIVQDGTPWERPATPRARALGRAVNQQRRGQQIAPQAQGRRRAAPDAGRERGGFASGTERNRSDEPGVGRSQIAGDMTLDEYGEIADALDLVSRGTASGSRDARGLEALRDAIDNAQSANDMIVMERNDFAAAKRAVDKWMSNPDNLPGGAVADLQDVLEQMEDADGRGKIWQSLNLEEEGTRLSGFASFTPTENRIIRDLFGRDRVGPYAREGDDRRMYDDYRDLFLEESDREDWDFDSPEYRDAFVEWLGDYDAREGERQDERRAEGFASSVGGIAGRLLGSDRVQSILRRAGVDEDDAEVLQALGEMAAAFTRGGPAGVGLVLARRAGREGVDLAVAKAVEQGWISDSQARRILSAADRVAPEGLPDAVSEIVGDAVGRAADSQAADRARQLADAATQRVRESIARRRGGRRDGFASSQGVAESVGESRFNEGSRFVDDFDGDYVKLEVIPARDIYPGWKQGDPPYAVVGVFWDEENGVWDYFYGSDDEQFETIDDALAFAENIEEQALDGVSYTDSAFRSLDRVRSAGNRNRGGFASSQRDLDKQTNEASDVIDNFVNFMRERGDEDAFPGGGLKRVQAGPLYGDDRDVGQIVKGPDGYGVIFDADRGTFDVLYTHDRDGNKLDEPRLASHDYEFDQMADTDNPRVQVALYNSDFEAYEVYGSDTPDFYGDMEDIINDAARPLGNRARRREKLKESYGRSGFASGVMPPVPTRQVPTRTGRIRNMREAIVALNDALESQRANGAVGNIAALQTLINDIVEQGSDGRIEISAQKARRALNALFGSAEFYDDPRLQRLADDLQAFKRSTKEVSASRRGFASATADSVLANVELGAMDMPDAAEQLLRARGLDNPSRDLISQTARALGDFDQLRGDSGLSENQIYRMLDDIETGGMDMGDVADFILSREGVPNPTNKQRRDKIALLEKVSENREAENEALSRALRATGPRQDAGRTRAAATQRATEPQTRMGREGGFASAIGRRSGGTGRITDAGTRRMGDTDGQYFDALTDAQKDILKEELDSLRDRILTDLAKKLPRFEQSFFNTFRTSLKDGVWDDEQLQTLEKYITQRFAPKKLEKLTDEQRAEEYAKKVYYQTALDNIRVLSGMKSSGKYDTMEQLHESARKQVVTRSRKKDSTMPTLTKSKSTGQSTLFGFADGFTEEEFQAEFQGRTQGAGRLRRLARRVEQGVYDWDDRRETRRQLRRNRRSGQGTAGGFTAEETSPGLGERARRRVRRAIRRTFRSKKGEAGILNNTVARDSAKAITFDGQGNADLKNLKRMAEALRTLRGQNGGFKKRDFHGGRAESVDDAQPDLRSNLELAVILQAQDMNAEPVLVSDSEMRSLIEQGWSLITRGFGNEQGAQNWLFDPRRFISDGRGGELSGPGEYWSTAESGAHWESWLASPGRVAALVPPNARRISYDDMQRNGVSNGQIGRRVFGGTVAQYGNLDDLKKADREEVVAQLKEALDGMSDIKDSEVGKLWSRLIDSYGGGDDSAMDTMELMASIGSAPGQKSGNYLAPLMGYDVIERENGTVLVMNRGAMVARDETMGQQDILQLRKDARDARREFGEPPKMDPTQGGSRRGKNVRRAGDSRQEGADATDAADTGSAPADGASSVPQWSAIQGMKKVDGPTGSNPAEWREDANGQRYLIKDAPSPQHASNEAAVGAIYNQFGVGAPTGVRTDSNGNPKTVITGLTGIKPLGDPTPAQQQEAKKHMGLDMALSNWDIRTSDNVVVDGSGKVIRLDAGGGGMFRARGGTKPTFAPGQPWVEPASMLSSQFGKSLYGRVTNGEMADAMDQVANLDIAAMDAAMIAAGVDPATRKIFRDVLAERKREATRLAAQFRAAPANNPVSLNDGGGDPTSASVSPGR